jgi:hypothetical protein
MAFARELLRSDRSAAAYQIEVSTNRLMLPAAWFSIARVKGLEKHDILVVGDVGAAGSSEIEDRGRIRYRLRPIQVARDQAPQILSHRHTQIAGAAPHSVLHFGVKRNLGS